MPFSPLPKIFNARLEQLAGCCGVVLDLGCGDGRFAEQWVRPGLSYFGLDRFPPAAGVKIQIRGDALRPPVGSGSVDLLTAANLVPHLLRQDPDGDFLARWIEAVRPGGDVFIFADEPAKGPPGRRNYRRLQEFLARLDPDRRGPLVACGDFRALVHRRCPGAQVSWGKVPNEYPLDVAAVLEWLGGAGGPGRGPAAALAAAIAADGLDLGEYWWLQVRITA